MKNTILDFKIVIAPHELGIERIGLLKDRFEGDAVLYSELNDNKTTEARVLIIDNIGMLSRIYSYADVAYIGGGFGVGIHNILEAATFGVPILIGPNYHKFKEARDLIEIKGAFSINDQSEFNEKIQSLVQNEGSRKISGDLCRVYVEKNLGATQKIIQYIDGVVDLNSVKK